MLSTLRLTFYDLYVFLFDSFRENAQTIFVSCHAPIYIESTNHVVSGGEASDLYSRGDYFEPRLGQRLS